MTATETTTAKQIRLRVDAINTYYGDSHVLRDVSLQIGAGETVALLGRNGVGKTTTLKSIVGWLRPRTGNVMLDDNGVIILTRKAELLAQITFSNKDQAYSRNIF